MEDFEKRREETMRQLNDKTECVNLRLYENSDRFERILTERYMCPEEQTDGAVFRLLPRIAEFRERLLSELKENRGDDLTKLPKRLFRLLDRDREMTSFVQTALQELRGAAEEPGLDKDAAKMLCAETERFLYGLQTHRNEIMDILPQAEQNGGTPDTPVILGFLHTPLD